MSADFFITAPKRYKRAGATKPFTVDLRSRLRSFWIAGRAYGANEAVRPFVANGFAFQANAAGQAGNVEPFAALGVITAGQQVVDGSITWTAIVPGTNALDPIASVAWSIVSNDGALSVVLPSHTNEEATAAFALGTAGMTYRIQALITTAAPLVYEVDFDLQVDI